MSVRTPRRVCTRTPADPSAFMTTALQSPAPAGHSIVWRPTPVVDRLQNACDAGGAGARAPAVRAPAAPAVPKPADSRDTPRR